MRRMRFVIAVSVACLAAAAGVAPALAGGGGNPQWAVEGSQLGSGESREIRATGTSAQKFKSGEATVACSGFEVEAGSVATGGSGVTPGTGTEQLVFTGCVVEDTSTEAEYAGCKVNSVGAVAGTLKTVSLKARLGYLTAGAAEREESNTVTVLKPESGTALLEMELSGEGCPTPGSGKYAIEGEMGMRNLEGGTEKVKHSVEAPSSPVKFYYLNSSGLPKEEKVKGLKIAGSASAVYTGTATVETTSASNWSVVH